MAKRMLIDAAHPEETRVVVLNGNRLEEFDFETSTKKQIKGNIYLAKVTRVEPSLQAAFVEYGGNRHGFLAFSEIHPDYYRIPVADRQAALADDRAFEEAREDEHEDGHVASFVRRDTGRYSESEAEPDGESGSEAEPERMAHDAAIEVIRSPATQDDDQDGSPFSTDEMVAAPEAETSEAAAEPDSGTTAADAGFFAAAPSDVSGETAGHGEPETAPESPQNFEAAAESAGTSGDYGNGVTSGEVEQSDGATVFAAPPQNDSIETVGGDEIEEESSRPRARPFRHYKIQEVIKRRQIMLVQVTKEERGNKGAALTTYLSLAGRYCVLMPNTPRGGGVSRKITNNVDRRRLKDLVSDLDMPEGMGVIVRTAGSERSKTEIKRDFEYLNRLWDEIRELTLRSTAPALIYEEGNLIKRSIRDLYSRDIEEVLVDGDEGYRTAKAFMKMLMPSHAKRVKPYPDPTVPLFHRFQVETQIDAIHSPVVQLRSGGYIVINPTEALVAIDVNSGRSTKERNIEETALKTNVEAAEEIARQLRLRDLAGLIVIDFIDMEEHRNQATVERRLKESMKNDRARIQLGRISPFGLLELSRQRLRPSLLEASTAPCPHCNGTGNIRSTESTALHVLRAIEEEGMRRRTAEVAIAVPTMVALYILNQKRVALQQTEARYGFSVAVTNDDSLIPPAFRLDRMRALTPAELAALPVPSAPPPEPEEDDEDEIFEDEDAVAEAPTPVQSEAAASDEESHGRSRRRRRRRGGDEGHDAHGAQAEPAASQDFAEESGAEEVATEMPGELTPAETEAKAPDAAAAGEQPEGDGSEADRKRRRRGRRGGRRRRRGGGAETGAAEGEAGELAAAGEDGEMSPESDGDDFQPAAGDAEEPFSDAGRPEAETVELIPVEQAPAEAVVAAEMKEVFAEPAETSAPTLSTESVPVAEDSDWNRSEPVVVVPAQAEHEPEPHPEPVPTPVATPAPEPQPIAAQAPQGEAERVPVQYNVPPTQEVTGPPANPRRGWWRR